MTEPVMKIRMNLPTVASFEGLSGKEYEQVNMYATPDNLEWANVAPNASLSMHVTEPTAFSKVKPGMYDVYLVPVPPPETVDATEGG